MTDAPGYITAETTDEIFKAFEVYRAKTFGAYTTYPLEACTYFGAGWKARGEWRAIETAPYGQVLGWVAFSEGRGAPFIVYKDEADMWCDDNDDQILEYKVTHWMPLPAPPSP